VKSRNCLLADDRLLLQPFNAFLSGFSATVGQFVLTVSLRMQTNPENKAEFESISHERYVWKQAVRKKEEVMKHRDHRKANYWICFGTEHSQTSSSAA
jgi:hypothetical protein